MDLKMPCSRAHDFTTGANALFFKRWILLSNTHFILANDFMFNFAIAATIF